VDLRLAFGTMSGRARVAFALALAAAWPAAAAQEAVPDPAEAGRKLYISS